MDTDKNSAFKNASTVHAVGARSTELRPATKVISALIKAGVLAGVAFVAWKVGAPLVTSVDAPTAIATAAVPSETKISSASERASLPAQASVSSIRTENDKSAVGEVTQLPEVQAQLPASLPAARKLAIDVHATDTTPSLAVKMWRAGQEFQAAALQAEGLELQPYYIEGDASQPTIGVGYNVKMSINTIGRPAVANELKQAGIDDANIRLLMDAKQTQSSQARVTVSQALALLDVATHRFRDSTRAAVGGNVFDQLPAHRQAALMWIDYNSNLHKRPNLLQAVRGNQTQRAIEEMETWITVHGKKIRSPNIVLAQAMYWSKEGLRQVVMNPSKIKRDAANNIVMWQPLPAPENAVPSVPQGTNIRATAGTAQRVPAEQIQPASNQLSGLKNVARVSPPAAHTDSPPAPSAPSATENPVQSDHQSTADQRRKWLNARNMRVVENPEPVSGPSR